jgi:UDP-2-acetamido-3-amino-2,3-dideoxy-glucuronate N-acetyltransferase
VSRVSDAPFVHPTALCHTDDLGASAQVLAFASLAPDVSVGARCTIGEHATLSAGVHVAEDATVRANAVLTPGVTVGRGAVIEPGAVVTAPVPANAIVQGNPALITGYVSGDPGTGDAATAPDAGSGANPAPTRVSGVVVYPLTRAADLRGSLTAMNFEDLPFVPQRIFTVFDVPSESIRGSHAHRTCELLLVCLTGAVNCVVDDGTRRDEVRLDQPDRAMHLPPMVWGTQYKYSREAVLLVLASQPYDPADYIRDYEEFLALVGSS